VNGDTRTPIRQQGPLGFRTGAPDGPIVGAGRRRVEASPGWTLAIAAVALVTGALALVDTDVTLRALAILVGLSSIGQGVMQLISTRRSGKAGKAGFRDHVMALVLIGIGAVCLLVPTLGKRGLLVGTAVWFVIVGVQELLGPSGRTRLWNVLLFVGSVAIAALMLLNAEAGLAVLARLFAVGMLVRGVLLVGRALTSWRARRRSPEVGRRTLRA